MRCMLLGCLVLSALMAHGQALPSSMLWSLSGQGLGSNSYLLGTVHSMDARAFVGNDSLYMALSACSTLVGELDHREVMADAFRLATEMTLPEGLTLADLFSRKDQALVQRALEHELGPLSSMTSRMKPFWVIAMLSESSMRKDSSEVLDDHLQRSALAMGKEVLGLETLQEQLAAIDRIPLKQQARMLLDMVRHDLYRSAMDRMLDSYAAQDLRGVMEAADAEGVPGRRDRAMRVERNRTMAHRMDSLMHTGRPMFFAVGAAHLPGKDGLMEMLRERGWMVRPVLGRPRKDP
ncbi:MAG: TraB/GumN family protein [Flavobacteriales bacterium]|nr:TraB/GumN family protein [Flavobacteriales bacterium]